MEVNIHEAKSQLSKLIDRALSGEEVIIAKAGKPVARLVRIERPARELGSAAGTIRFAEGWDAPLDGGEIEALFGH